ncbi:MAG: type II toxin-antitoxin system ParD family antitoxin [Thermomicrobiales bacterium]
MAIQIPADIEARIRQKVERGDYPNENDVIRQALRLLDEQEDAVAALRAKLQIGLDQLDRGEGRLFTPELVNKIRQEVEVRYRRGDLPNPDVTP